MSDDISNRTVLVLVVLTILISTLGTLTVSNSVKEVKSMQVPVVDEAVDGSAQVSLAIVNNNYVPEPDQITGRVALSIAGE